MSYAQCGRHGLPFMHPSTHPVATVAPTLLLPFDLDAPPSPHTKQIKHKVHLPMRPSIYNISKLKQPEPIRLIIHFFLMYSVLILISKMDESAKQQLLNSLKTRETYLDL